MFDIKWIRDNPDTFDEGLRRRGLEPASAALVELDGKRRQALTRAQEIQARRKLASKEVGDPRPPSHGGLRGHPCRSSRRDASPSNGGV